MTFNPFSTNCYVIESDGCCAIIDPGCHSDRELRQLTSYVSKKSLKVEKLLLTHAHIDHVFGCKAIADCYNLPFFLHDGDLQLFHNGKIQAEIFRLPLDLDGVDVMPIEPGMKISVGSTMLDVLHTPGHSPGSVSFVDHKCEAVFSGDVLFRGSIGRTDLWGGSLPVLMNSIVETLLPLGDGYVVYSGHGPETTIGQERATNPFLTS